MKWKWKVWQKGTAWYTEKNSDNWIVLIKKRLRFHDNFLILIYHVFVLIYHVFVLISDKDKLKIRNKSICLCKYEIRARHSTFLLLMHNYLLKLHVFTLGFRFYSASIWETDKSDTSLITHCTQDPWSYANRNKR